MNKSIKSKYRIGIMTCYFGKFPQWMQLWLNSCVQNRDIDFFLVTDSDTRKYFIPENVHIINDTLKGFHERLEKVLNRECVLTKPYKLCDYKPFYGLVYCDVLKNFDFWGHCDIDMIFGNLRNFLTDDILEKYDKLFEMGHLSLYRNCDEINNMYKLPGAMISFDQMISDERYCGFDEHTGTVRICEINGIKTYRDVVCADIDPHWRMFVMMDEVTVHGKMKSNNYNHQIFVCESGHIFQYYIDRNDDVGVHELAYIHFMRKYPTDGDSCITSNKYIITNKKFIDIEGIEITTDIIKKYDNSVGGIFKKIEYAFNFIKHGFIAVNNGELLLRLKLRIGRIKGVNKRAMRFMK